MPRHLSKLENNLLLGCYCFRKCKEIISNQRSALTYNVLVKSLLGSYKLYTILRWRGDLHPIILTFRNRYTILCALHELILETFEAVEADGRHVPILESDGAFGWLVLPDKWEVHDTESSDPLPVGLDVAHEADVVVDVVLSKRGGQGILLILISRPLFHNTVITKGAHQGCSVLPQDLRLQLGGVGFHEWKVRSFLPLRL